MRKPARRLQKSAVKNIVRFPTTKTNSGQAILVESILEAQYCFYLEFDQQVASYYPQPHTFEIEDEYGCFKYTPDFEVHYKNGEIEYHEIKPTERLKEERFANVVTRFNKYIENRKTKLRVITDEEIYRQPLLENYEKLYQYKKRQNIDYRKMRECLESVSTPINLNDLIMKLDGRAELKEIYAWIAYGYISFDIAKEKISLATEVRHEF